MKKWIKIIWKKIDGKKTCGGIIITAIGTVMYNFTYTEQAAPIVLYAGLATLGIGGGHKIKKKVESNMKEKQ